MFDFVRKHTKVMMFLMFLLIIPAFVLVGINGFRSMSAGGETVAKVGSLSIDQAEWDAAHKSEVDRMRASMPNIDPKLLDSPQAKYVTLERLVREHVLSEAANRLHLTTTDARLARELQQNPTIAAMRGPDGRIDIERYRQLAASQGLTTEGLEQRVRNDLTLRQLESGIQDTALATAAQANVSLNAFFERRDVQMANFVPADYEASVQPSAADLEAYYQAHPTLFQAPESASVDYVVLDLDSIKKSVSVSADDVKSYYEQNAERLSGKEERRARHILINAPKDMPAAQREQAKAHALDLLAQVRKSPESFADVAKKNSQDSGSAPNGGDLDFFARGAMVKPFEDAVFSMKKGDISELVESDFGYHIIQLTDIRAPKQKSLDELRAGIEADLRTQMAQHKFAELAETFTNTVYEQSDSLQAVADKLKLEIRHATEVTRVPNASIVGVLSNRKLLTAVFSADAIEKKHNTEAIETGPNQLASARIAQYSPAHLLPLDQVRKDVQSRLVAQRALERAVQDGTDKLAAWKQHPEQAKLPVSASVSRDQAKSFAPELLDAVMRADVASTPAWVGVNLGSKGYAVVRINQVSPRAAPPEATAKQERAQYTQWLAQAENQAYLEYLKTRYKAQVKVAKPGPMAALPSSEAP